MPLEGAASAASFHLHRISLTQLLAGLVAASWLLPNHYQPWPTAWQDGCALALVLSAAVFVKPPVRIQGAWLAAVAVAGCSVVAQLLGSRIYFVGDALMVLLYLAAFLAALVVGRQMVADSAPSQPALTFFATVTLGAAMCSVGIALTQWTGAFSLGLFGADLPPGARPFANVAQPNHLCSLAFIGLCATLFLRENRTLSFGGTLAMTLFMLLGMVMSGSRTGWLQIGSLVVLGLVFGHRCSARVRWVTLAALSLTFIAMTLTWPVVNDLLLLTGGRSVLVQADGGARGPLWVAMLDAAVRQPVWGYGWQQMVLAQQAVALDYPALQRHFEHSHNLVLDLVLWAGVPVAAAICAFVLQGLWQIMRPLNDARALWLLASVMGLIMHSMVEFPLEHAYFLVPAGIAIGAIGGLSTTSRQLRLSANWTRACAATVMALLIAVGADYLEAEQNHRLLRLESAGIGTDKVDSAVPELLLLTQLRAFLALARTPARVHMSEEELEQFRRASERFAYPSAMLRYALAAGLNGKPDVAQTTLQRLCSMHPLERCKEAGEAWSRLQRQWQQLSRVPPPQLPFDR